MGIDAGSSGGMLAQRRRDAIDFLQARRIDLKDRSGERMGQKTPVS